MDEKETLRVGVAVRRRRRAMALTLAAVAERSGLSVPFLSQIENERARPSERSLQQIADALDTTTTDDPGRPGARALVRGQHQMHAEEFTGEHDAGRELVLRNDAMLYVADGTAQVEAEGRAYRLEKGDTLYLSGGVRHRWRAGDPDTRILVVAVAEHIEAGGTGA
jgi:transcriptional regulator with XRE-family HTH domain